MSKPKPKNDRKLTPDEKVKKIAKGIEEQEKKDGLKIVPIPHPKPSQDK